MLCHNNIEWREINVALIFFLRSFVGSFVFTFDYWLRGLSASVCECVNSLADSFERNGFDFYVQTSIPQTRTRVFLFCLLLWLVLLLLRGECNNCKMEAVI